MNRITNEGVLNMIRKKSIVEEFEKAKCSDVRAYNETSRNFEEYL